MFGLFMAIVVYIKMASIYVYDDFEYKGRIEGKKHSSLWGGLMWSKLPLWEEYKYIQNTDFFIAENNNCFFFIVIVLLLTTCMQILTS